MRIMNIPNICHCFLCLGFVLAMGWLVGAAWLLRSSHDVMTWDLR